MWFIFAVLLVLWVLGIHFYVPFVFTLLLFAGMLIAAGIALLPSEELRN
jgi:hypothetical protein